MAGRNGRPPSINSRWFYRELTMPDKLILACAGNGNISDGFRNVLDAYQILWNCGYRPEMDLHDFLGVDMDSIEKPLVGGSKAN